eukprot:SAG31_NODE_17504_length_668_cov_1.114236_1_plen_160_part_10
MSQVQPVVERAFKANGVRVTNAAAGADIFWSEDYPFGAHPDVLAAKAVNHVPGIYFLAVKQSLCDHTMQKKRRHSQSQVFASAADCYLMDLERDRKALQRIFDEERRAGTVSHWMAKRGSHRNTSILSSDDPVPATKEMVVQRLVEHPFLADGHKAELRL